MSKEVPFARNGGGWKIFAKMIHVNVRLLGAWELERKRMSINSWNRYFKDIVKW